MEYEDIIEKRRAVNFFDTQRQVPDTLLRQMIEMAAKAPSSFNLQPWNLVVVKETAEKERLKALAWDQPKVAEAPVILMVLGDKTGWREGHPTLERNWEELVRAGDKSPEQRAWFLDATRTLYGESTDKRLAFAAKNAGFFAMGLMYAATSLGLETHPMDGFDHEGVRKAFCIPDQFWVPLIIAVGYLRPGVALSPPKWRKTHAQIVVSF